MVGDLGGMLGHPIFPMKWEETTMDDGKPLVMSIVENHGSLFLEFTKTGEGLWAESRGVICKTGTDVEDRFSGEQIRLGPAASWLLRLALKNKGKNKQTKNKTDQKRNTTNQWSGIF